MKLLEKGLWIMIITYTLISILRGEYYSLIFLALIITIRIVIWRLGSR